MKRIAFFITIAVLVSTAIACTKFGKNITVKGKILNPITNEPIQGVEVRLLKSDHSDYAGGYKKIQSTISDTDGSFEIEATRLGPIWLSTNITEYEKYYKLGWLDDTEGKYYSMKKVDKGKIMNINCHLVPYGQLQIKIKNTACFNSLDKVGIYFDGEYVDSKTFMKGLLYEKDGCIDVLDSPVKTTIGKKYFHWVVTKNNITTTYYDTIFVNENQTTTLNVLY